jgi:hypothetical protein
MTKFFFILPLIFVALSAYAECEPNFARAEKIYGIPKGYLRAISETEVGIGAFGKLRSWSLNVDGNSMYFRDKRDAIRYLSALDIKNIDVGCMQINKYWHGDKFASLREMLDPNTNIHYAAFILRSTYNKTKSWEKSVKFFHSRKPIFHKPYFEKFARNLKKF